MTCRPKRADMLAAETDALRLVGVGPACPLDVWRCFVEHGLVDVHEDGWVYIWCESRSGRMVRLERAKGYGPAVKHRLSMTVDGQRFVTYSHHLLWDEYFGPVPDGHVVCRKVEHLPWTVGNLSTKPNARAAQLRGRVQRQASLPEGPRDLRGAW